jgi:signal transduction histidine kinase
VVKNILENAIKYTDPLSKPIELGYWENEKEIAITFSDQGKGISKADLQFIFEPFYRADKSRSRKTGGYGLGLALCKKIMEAHKGRILIDSEEGKGTVIQLVFDKFFSG